MTQQSVASLIQARYSQFIETRTVIECEVNKFLESLNKEDEDIKKQLGVREGITCRDLLPELWKPDNEFNEEVYQTQLNSLLQYIQQVQVICDKINAEAIACLQS